MSETIKEQQPAPDFTLPAIGSDDVVKNGQVHLADLKGKTIVTTVHFSYFHPTHVGEHSLYLIERGYGIVY